MKPQIGKALVSVVWLAVLAGATVAIFWQSADFPFVVLDDPSFIEHNELVTAPGQADWRDFLLTPLEGYIIPVTTAFQATVWALGDGAPGAFHVAGIVLHLMLVVLVFFIAKHLVRCPIAAGLGAALFAVHPLVVEPVVWATGNKDLVMATLAFAATAVFVSGVEAAAREPGAGNTRLVVALLLALLSFLAKPASALIGLAWIAYLLARHFAGQGACRRAVAVGLGATAIGVLVGLVSRASMYENIVESSQPILADLRFFTVLGNQGQHLLWPRGLHPIYDIDTSAGFSDTHTWLGLAIVVVVVGLLAVLRRKSAAVLGLGLAVAFYLPVSGIIPFPRIMADSYMYAPLAGAAIFVAWAISKTFASASKARITTITASVGLLLVPLGVCSWHQVARWQGGRALWEPVVEEYPDLALAHDALATALLMGDEPGAAAEHFKMGFDLEYRPEFLGDFGVSLAEIGDLDGAECVLIEAYYHGVDRDRALQNYAIVVTDHFDRPPRYREQARWLLPIVEARAAQGKIELSVRMRHGLMVQRERVGGVRRAGGMDWPRGTCELRSQ